MPAPAITSARPSPLTSPAATNTPPPPNGTPLSVTVRVAPFTIDTRPPLACPTTRSDDAVGIDVAGGHVHAAGVAGAERLQAEDRRVVHAVEHGDAAAAAGLRGDDVEAAIAVEVTDGHVDAAAEARRTGPRRRVSLASTPFSSITCPPPGPMAATMSDTPSPVRSPTAMRTPPPKPGPNGNPLPRSASVAPSSTRETAEPLFGLMMMSGMASPSSTLLQVAGDGHRISLQTPLLLSRHGNGAQRHRQ